MRSTREPDGRLVLHEVHVERRLHLVEVAEDLCVAVLALDRRLEREPVGAEDHVLARRHDRLAIGRLQDVARREHQVLRLGLRGRGQRHVHGHLVAVEVGAEGLADERVDLDRVAFDELRHERLDAQAVQRGRAVEEDRVILDDLFQDVPHLG